MSAPAKLPESVQWAFDRLSELPRNQWWQLEEGEPLYLPIPERMVRRIPGHAKSVWDVSTWWEVRSPDGSLVAGSRASIRNQIRCSDVLVHANAIGKMRNGNLAINRGQYVVTAIDGDDVHLTRKDVWLEEFPSSPMCAELRPEWPAKVDMQLAPRFVRFEHHDQRGLFYARQVNLATGSHEDRLDLSSNHCTPASLRGNAIALMALAERLEAEGSDVA